MNSANRKSFRRQHFENWLLFAVLAITGIFTMIDIYTDVGEGASFGHLGGEAIIALFSLGGAVLLWMRIQGLKEEVTDQKEIAAQAEAARSIALEEAVKWRKEASNAIRGLSDAIDSQLTKWKLTSAEKEVALLLLKGLSLKEIADVRGVSEKTARAQSFSLYAKSSLGGRAELSAFFLEDLMLPSSENQNRSFDN
jgi:DNA-binding CsgD family transcriptional regulator